MEAKRSLSGSEREFLMRLDDFVFGNPFSVPRETVLTQLIPDVPLSRLMKDVEALPRVVEARMSRFDRGARARIGDFPGEDQLLVRTAYVYLAYHRHLPDFDRLIDRQLASASNPEVPFAASLLTDLAQRGMAEDEASRFFAFMFQLRRAYYFIVGLRMLVGDSPSMRQLRLSLWNSVFTHDMRRYRDRLWNRMEDCSTLLLGETGTGKGNAAAVIGRSAFIPFSRAERRFVVNFTQSFIALNLSQFPETLIESELFGHRKGAFTGAVENHKGVLELCSEHGALFLDEIGEVSAPVQIKLLRVLQDRTFTSLGSHEPRHFGGRVIAATNRPWGELRAEGRFRDDFYYRLCSDVIRMPTLRERIAESARELEDLVRPLVVRIAGEEQEELVPFVLEALGRDLPRGYGWPGNVRELEQAVRRIMLTGRYTGNVDDSKGDLDLQYLDRARAGSLSAKELVGRYCAMLYRQLGTYAEVAARTGLDRRTARKYVVDFSVPDSHTAAES